MNNIRWGILATGKIAHAMAQALSDLPEAELAAVASRTKASAEAFGNTWNIPKRYGSYAELAMDDEIDVVYIATPHSEHYENMLLCLNAGKNILCEKAFTLNAPQAEACIKLARQNKLFLMEAMWTRFFPLMGEVRKWLEEERIGEIRMVQADFCINVEFDPEGRFDNPLLGGGALLDLGIYPIALISMVLGLPDAVSSQVHLSPTGVDELSTMLFHYDGGASGLLSCSTRVDRPKEAFIIGTTGFIKIHDLFYRPDRASLHISGEEPQTLEFPYESNGYTYEVREVHDCLRSGRLESAIMSLDETLELMKVMDALRAEWGVVYPNEMDL